MDKTKQQLLNQTIDTFLDECGLYNNPEKLKEVVDHALTGIGTTIYEKVNSLERLEALLKFQKEQTFGKSISYKTQLISHYISNDENTATVAKDLTLYLEATGETTEIYVRISLVLEYKINKWLVVHWHASSPEKVDSEKDTFGFEALKQKTVALEKEIKDRTTELVEKNKELEIEAALEKVRSRSMAMQKSEELLEVIAVVAEQLQLLNFKFAHVSFANNDSTQDYKFWTSSPGMSKPMRFKTPYIDIAVVNNLRKAQNDKASFMTDVLTKEEHMEWHNHLLNNGGAEVFTEEENDFVSSRGMARSIAINPNIILIVANYASIPYSAIENKIIAHFGQVFEQSYTRFLDLQKAEVQTREAKIEAALEKVRSVALSLKKSDELLDVAEVLYHQLFELGFNNIRNVIIDIHTDTIGGFLDYDYSPEMGKTITVMTYNDHPILEMQVEKIHASTDGFFEIILEGKDLQELIALRIKNGEEADLRLNQASQLTYNLYSFGNGEIGISSFGVLASEQKIVLKRFRNVFKFAYKRYTDLAEAELREYEAKIEASLEKVRGVALSLTRSEQMIEVAQVLYEQLLWLGFANIRNTIIDINNDDGKTFTDYDYSTEMKGAVTIIAKDADSIITQQIKQTEASNDAFFEVNIEGNDLLKLIETRKKIGEKDDPRLDNIEQLTYNLYSFGNGAIGISNFGALSQKEKKLLKQFRNVFTFAYKRYTDIKQAEQLAKQAQIDLKNLILAKQKAENALRDLQQTQRQLIQSEKMASLGELTAGIAHEIQNPLNFVNNFSEVSNELLDEIKEERTKNTENRDEKLVDEILEDIKLNLEKINHHGKRADAIVKGMLQHSRSSSGTKEPTDVNKLADEYLLLAYHGLRAKDKSFNVNLVTNFDKVIGKINIIPQGIGRVILNLITNAFYATNEKLKIGVEDYKPTVTVSTKTHENNIKITVSDNGNGIPEKVLDKIFQPFFTTKPSGQGTGLGLSLAYDIIKAHGGELKVNTEENVGSEFIIVLPIS